MPANAYAFVELPRPGRFDVETARALGVPEGPLFGRLQAGEAVELPDGGKVGSEQVWAARPGRKVVLAGDTAPSASVWRSPRRRRARPRGDLRRGGAHARGRDAPLHGGRRRRWPRPLEVRLLALTHLSNRYFGPEIAREAREVFGDGGSEGLRYHRRSVPGAGRAPSREGGARRRERRPGPMASMVQVAVAGDLTEAEEIQTILESAGIPSELHTRSRAASGGTR